MTKDNSAYITIKNRIYRQNVGIIVFNKDGKVLFCKRNQKEGKYGWQFPQGGIDIGETAMESALRELEEETGLSKSNVKVVYEDESSKIYNFPKRLKEQSKKKSDYYNKVSGQNQTWFLIRFDGSDSEFKIPNEEMMDYKWIDFSADIVSQIIPFKRDVYKYILKKFSPILKEAIKDIAN